MFKWTQRTGCIFALAVMFFIVCRSVNAQIAPGEQQSAAQTATITGTVIQSNGTPIAGADVKLTGPAILATKSDAHGLFVFTSVPFGIYRFDALAAGLGTVSRAGVAVKADINIAIQYVATTSGPKEIAHVSTSNAGAHINVTGASVASVTPSDWAFQGNTSWQQLLNRIPGVSAGGDLTSSNGGPFGSGLLGPFQPVILSINGALPYETSVTLDGMPINNESAANTNGGGNGVDLSLLPMAAFDTADVVRGPGANAPSVVDSIGGSFVLHGPGQVEKNQFEFSVSNDAYGGILSNVKAALRLGRLSATIVYGLDNSPGPLGNTSVLGIPFSAPVTINGQAFNGCTAPSACFDQPIPTPGTVYQNCFCAYTNSLFLGGTPSSTAWTSHNGALGLSYNISPLITASVLYAGSSSAAPNGGVFVTPTTFTPGPGYSGAVSPGTYTIPATYQNNGDSFAQSSSLLEEKITAFLGKGVVRLAAMQDNSYNQFTLSSGTANGIYTLYGSGFYASAPSTQVNFNGTPAFVTFSPFVEMVRYRSQSRDLLGSYAIPLGPTSTAAISYVTSSYHEPQQLVLFLSGALNFCNFGICNERETTTANSERTDELRINAGTRVSDKLSLDASWYIARGTFHVPNPNNTHLFQDSVFPYSAPRMSAVWRANPDIVVRAAAGGSFALPNLFSLVGSNTTDCSLGFVCYLNLENLNLQPEHSFSVDIGADIRSHRDTVTSFDFYNTNLYGQFFQGQYQDGTFMGVPLIAIETLNLAHSRMEGINLSVRHDVPHGLYWGGSLALTRAYLVSIPAGFYDQLGQPGTCTSATPQYCNGLTYAVTGANFNGQFEAPVPYTSGSAQIGYRWSAQKYIDLSPTYYGNNNLYLQPAFVEFDAHAGYPLSKNVSLLATFRNITGIYDQNYVVNQPSNGNPPAIGAPAYVGAPFAPFGLVPYGPRTVIVTVNFKS